MKKIISVLLTFALVFCGAFYSIYYTAPQVSAAKTAAQLNQEKAAAQAAKDAANKKLKELKSQKASQEKILAQLKAKVSATQKEIDICNAQIALLKNQIAENEAIIKKNEQELEETKEIFSQRVRAMYLTGGSGGLEILVGTDNFSDYLLKAELLTSVSKQDNALMQGISKIINETKTAKAAIETKKEEQQTVYKELAARQSEQKADVAEAATVEAKISSNITMTQKEINEYNSAIDKANKEIKALTEVSVNIKYKGDKFTWPTPGYYSISSPYGYRNSTRSFHAGIDIANGGSIYGKKIVASLDGQVTGVKNNSGGYGKYVTIAHGSDGGKTYATLYAHCSSIIVSEGQMVKKDQTIAYVGSTGRSTGPHLHFEIRVNGKAVNPMDYFKK